MNFMIIVPKINVPNMIGSSTSTAKHTIVLTRILNVRHRICRIHLTTSTGDIAGSPFIIRGRGCALVAVANSRRTGSLEAISVHKLFKSMQHHITREVTGTNPGRALHLTKARGNGSPSLLLLEKRKGTLDVSWGHVCNIGSPCSRSLLLLLLRKNTNEVSGGQISEALRLILILEPEKKRKLLYSVHALRLRQSCCNGGLVTIGCWRENCSEEQR